LGQQQLLLIILAIIIVGIAIAISIQLFRASAIDGKRDLLMSECSNIATIAISYYKKPREMGGGGKTFTGWTIPTGLDSTANGTYSATVNAQSVTIPGLGTETGDDGTNPVRATCTVSPTTISVAVNN